MDATLKHPFTCMVAGPTSCGKTHWVSNLLRFKDIMITPKIEKVIWCYSKWQPTYDKLKGIVDTFQEGLENLKPDEKKVNTIVVLDDLQREAQNGQVAEIFERGSHHDNMSIIYITQNVFHQGRDTRDISLNTHYMVYFKHPRDRSQITNLARQVFPQNVKFLQGAYDNATHKAHGYLFLDFKQTTPDEIRFRTNILPCENSWPVVYIPEQSLDRSDRKKKQTNSQ